MRFGHELNAKIVEYLTTDVNESRSIKINGTVLSRTQVFKYLKLRFDALQVPGINNRVNDGLLVKYT